MTQTLVAKHEDTRINEAMNVRPVTLRLKIILTFLVGAALLSVTCCDVFSQSFGLSKHVQTVLENADTFTLFSLDPNPDFKHKAKTTLEMYSILGQVTVRSTGTRRELIDALNEGISAAGQSPGAGCFNPRHAIFAKKGGAAVELLICFQCGHILIKSGRDTNDVITTADPGATFNKVLKDAGVPLPKN